jgi:hypothetical protein
MSDETTNADGTEKGNKRPPGTRPVKFGLPEIKPIKAGQVMRPAPTKDEQASSEKN